MADIVLVELTRPADGRFAVRLFEEGIVPPWGEVSAAFVLYGADVGGVGGRLERAWASLGLQGIVAVRHVCYRSYDHPRSFDLVLRTVEALQASHLP